MGGLPGDFFTEEMFVLHENMEAMRTDKKESLAKPDKETGDL